MAPTRTEARVPSMITAVTTPAAPISEQRTVFVRAMPGIVIHLGGVTINMREGASTTEARRLGREAAAALTEKMKHDLSRYLLDVLGAEQALRMPDELE